MPRTAKTPAERLKGVARKKKVVKERASNAPELSTVQAKVEQGVALTNNDQGVLNEDRVSKYVAEYIAENKCMPTPTHISEVLNMSFRTAQKHLQKVIGNDFIKKMAKNLNGHVVAQHFNMIMDREKASAGLFASWYDHFGITEKTNIPVNANGNKIVINIVGVEPKRIEAEDAEVID